GRAGVGRRKWELGERETVVSARGARILRVSVSGGVVAERAVERVRARGSAWLLLGPGLLLAATGVGGGDLATGSIVGSLLGTTVLWAAVVGAALKLVVTEGLARWQLATGQTFLEGAAHRLGPIAVWLFLPYLFLWSFFVGSAMMSACGIALHAIFPVFDDSQTGRVVFGAA